ncbi:MAG TPA: DoxX family protein [Candidatus Kryptonia bacterium]|nr:DoxX family protein [Candidatus Kryptonia bacterium]
MDWLSHPQAIGRFLVTAFFAVVFLQSAMDKLIDREGNLAFFGDHFKNSPVAALVPLLFWVLTLIEATAGGLCALGVLLGDFSRAGMGVAASGVSVAGLALLSLLVGQRMAKDYAGAAVIAAYFAVALLGGILFATPP